MPAIVQFTDHGVKVFLKIKKKYYMRGTYQTFFKFYIGRSNKKCTSNFKLQKKIWGDFRWDCLLLRGTCFWWGLCCLFFSFLSCILCSIVCLIVFVYFSHGVVRLFSIFEFECSSGINLARFCRNYCMYCTIVNTKWFKQFTHFLLV